MAYRGRTWKEMTSGNLDGCEDSCKLYSKCNAYSFDSNKHACHLKNRVSKMRKQSNIVSGELRRSYIRKY